MRIRGEMKETLLEAVRIELLSRMIDMLPLSMYRRRRCVQHSFAQLSCVGAHSYPRPRTHPRMREVRG